MSESSDIPTGTYSLSLGKSFDTKSRKNDPKAAQFHTLRYDFKPSSVSNNTDNTFIAFGANSQDVHVSVPSEGGDNMTVYKGSKKDAKPKECLLFFDKKTGTVRLEKITSNINVKKTRDLDPATEQALKRGIERLRTSTSSRRHPQRSSSSSPEQKQRPPPPHPDTTDTESESESDSDKSNAESSDGDDERALMEQMEQQQKPPAPTSSSNQYHHRQDHNVSSSYNNHYGSSSNSSRNNTKNTKDNEKYGLALSESSDEDE